MNIVTVTPPTAEPVSLPEALVHCRIHHQKQNDYVSGLITAAREYVEQVTGVVMLATTFRQTFDQFPKDGILRLMRAPLSSVASVAYIDTAGSSQTISPSSYVVDADGRPPRIASAPSTCWPSVECDRLNAIAVTFTAGHATADAVPANLKAAIKLLVQHWFEQRDPFIVGSIVTEVPIGVRSLLRLNRVRGNP